MKIASIFLITTGILAVFAGAFIKIMHWPNANILMQVGLVAQWIGIGLFAFYYVQKRKQAQ